MFWPGSSGRFSLMAASWLSSWAQISLSFFSLKPPPPLFPPLLPRTSPILLFCRRHHRPPRALRHRRRYHRHFSEPSCSNYSLPWLSGPPYSSCPLPYLLSPPCLSCPLSRSLLCPFYRNSTLHLHPRLRCRRCRHRHHRRYRHSPPQSYFSSSSSVSPNKFLFPQP